MEKYVVDMPKKKYLETLKCKMDSPFYVFQERVTGIILGPFFTVAYYAPWEWNRRITAECNRAFGFVREVDGKTTVTFLRGKGLLSPLWLIFYTLLCMLMFGGTGMGTIGVLWGASFGCAFIACGVTAIQSCLTENGIAGAGEITKLLTDPENYF